MTEKAHELAARYWPMIVGLLAIAASWGALTSQIGAVADNQKQVAIKLDRQSELLAGFRADVAATQASAAAQEVAIADFRMRLRAVEARR